MFKKDHASERRAVFLLVPEIDVNLGEFSGESCLENQTKTRAKQETCCCSVINVCVCVCVCLSCMCMSM